jgi:hypothetical protein
MKEPRRRRNGYIVFTYLSMVCGGKKRVGDHPPSPLPEPVFLNVNGAQELIPRNEFLQPM